MPSFFQFASGYVFLNILFRNNIMHKKSVCAVRSTKPNCAFGCEFTFCECNKVLRKEYLENLPLKALKKEGIEA